jgi:putative nucleotidyltransferase with HDIG domain
MDRNGNVLYKENFYFTSREQVINLLDHGIKSVKINLALSLVGTEQKPEKTSTLKGSTPKKATAEKKVEPAKFDPIKRYEQLKASIAEVKEFYDEGEKLVANLMDSARFGKSLDKKSIQNHSGKILKNVQRDPQLAFALLSLKNYDQYTHVHSLNVAVLSVAFALHLRFSPEHLLSIAKGGILHDIGKAKLPQAIINKSGALDETEKRIIQKHPGLGVQVLQHDHIRDAIMEEIILSHHESYDGSGYPNRYQGNQVKRFASIVSVSDFYDALTTKRSYKSMLDPPEAMQIVYAQSGKKFDPRIINHFIKIVGIYPIGSMVELSDGRIAMVISFSYDQLLTPVVKTMFYKGNINRIDKEIISLSDSNIHITGVYKGGNHTMLDVIK